MIYWNILLIAIICVIIIDLSGFIDSVKHFIWKKLYNPLPYKDFDIKPFTCSLCSTFWLSLIYVIIIHQLSIPVITYILVISYFTTTIKDIILFIKDFFIKIMDELYTFFKIY